MRLLNDYYKPYGGKTRIYGAVINVVLSLGYHIQYCEHGDAHAGFNDVKIKACVNNVRAMLDELMTRDQDTLGLQALLGLVILYQTQPDQTASSVLMSAAMRLAHSLRLESKTVLSELPPQEARQRNNIFWVCYMLDKDISLRTITPSLQLDSDIDMDLPSPANDDHGSVLYSADGLSQFHLFRAKVQLAHLEGRIYDTLFSNRSRKLSHEARQEAIAQIDGLLDRWAKSIPTAFQLKNISGNLLKGPLVHMTVLYQTYIMCFTMTHGLYAHNSPWLKALGGLGSDLLRTFNPQHDACMDGGTSSTPVVWEKCVSTSRDILNIFSYQ
ncbi:putative fungal specific transcription factor domain-containing protein [Rosellinia necatrix]|uniref:Putative fungal specific transcription factor domain-containing protein n=1 Tax=Rosellinia necatrix TaxID=77044 RepID=A0A1S8A803_ROSNE|nr:putative fungal specific transcription factor domain-containing protein [Rosellinia necatrix]